MTSQRRDWLTDVFFSHANDVKELLDPLDGRGSGGPAERVSPLRDTFQVRGLKPTHFDLFFDRMAACASPVVRTILQRFALLVCALTLMPVHDWALHRATERGPLWVERFRSTMVATSEVFHEITCTETGQRRPIASYFMRVFCAYLLVDRVPHEPPVQPQRRLSITFEDEVRETDRKRKQAASRHQRDLHLDSDDDDGDDGDEGGIQKKRK
jgi:hypothetical protein